MEDEEKGEAMTVRGARRFFIGITAFFSVTMLILTYNSLGYMKKSTNEDLLTPQVVAGKKVWQKYNCINCHTILGNGAYFGPDLTKVTDRKPEDYLRKWMMDPPKVMATTAMPNMGISEREIEDLLAFLQWVSRINTQGWPPKPVLVVKPAVAELPPKAQRGAELYQANKVAPCTSCHAIKGFGGAVGPDLTKVGTRRDRDWILGHFLEPQKYAPGSAMPSYRTLSKEDLEALTEYLLTLR